MFMKQTPSEVKGHSFKKFPTFYGLRTHIYKSLPLVPEPECDESNSHSYTLFYNTFPPVFVLIVSWYFVEAAISVSGQIATHHVKTNMSLRTHYEHIVFSSVIVWCM